ncbi:uncharacterized protein LOC103570051 [Microplitis demolitor]|uniref:uncharacterized protein LOC103570051 n=1 Tax=Microplitis demolitor TaxID=69319 RepID=UPI0006D514E1|nr:uncharacterized protein LOC103570051 [Microplitis demolitor]
MSNFVKQGFWDKKNSLANSNKVKIINVEKGSKAPQFIAAIAANICVMAGGAMVVWSNPILLMLGEDPVNKENPLGRSISAEEESWIGSLNVMGSMIGSLFPGYFAER